MEVHQNLEIGLASLNEFLRRRDCRGDRLAVTERFENFDALSRIPRTRRADPGSDTLLTEAVEGDRGYEHRMLQQFSGRRVFARILRIDHERIGLAARLVVVEDVFLGDCERSLCGTRLADRGIFPSFIVFPTDHKILGEMPLLLGLYQFL